MAGCEHPCFQLPPMPGKPLDPPRPQCPLRDHAGSLCLQTPGCFQFTHLHQNGAPPCPPCQMPAPHRCLPSAQQSSQSQCQGPSVSAFTPVSQIKGLPWWLRWGRIRLQCGRPRFHPWVGKILRRREWQPTLISLPRESHRRAWRATVLWVRRESDRTLS